MHLLVGVSSHAVQTNAQSHHIKLGIRVMRDSGGIQDVPHRLVTEGFGDFRRYYFKPCNLPQRKPVVLRVFGGGEMAENGRHVQARMLPQRLNQFCNVLRLETQPVHARFHFHMNPDRIIIFFQEIEQLLQDARTVNFRFQLVIN